MNTEQDKQKLDEAYQQLLHLTIKGNAELLVKELSEREMTISFAESCTGGLAAAYIIGVAGASEVLKESFVTYSNESKQELLNVQKDTIEAYDVVSKEVADEMLQGLQDKTFADVYASVTGYAGSSDSTKVPAGTVYVGIGFKNNRFVHKVPKTKGKSRNTIRLMAVDYIFKAILAQLNE